MSTPPMPHPVAAAFDAMPGDVRDALLPIRKRLFAVADATGTGPLSETLKWGEPAYLTEATKAGSTVRLGISGGRAAVFFNCNTALVDGFRSDFPEAFDYVGNRALLVGANTDDAVLDICLTRALTYHRTKRKRRAS